MAFHVTQEEQRAPVPRGRFSDEGLSAEMGKLFLLCYSPGSTFLLLNFLFPIKVYILTMAGHYSYIKYIGY